MSEFIRLTLNDFIKNLNVRIRSKFSKAWLVTSKSWLIVEKITTEYIKEMENKDWEDTYFAHFSTKKSDGNFKHININFLIINKTIINFNIEDLKRFEK